MGRFRSIQILRGAAALLVLWHHACLPLVHRFDLNWIFPEGFRLAGMFGVDLFFVISGFVIAKSAFGAKSMSASDFMLRRLERIVPLYWLMTLPWVPIVQTWRPFDWRQASATLTFWPAYDRMALPILGVGWSLCYEMLFYALAAVVLMAKRSVFVIGAIATVFLAVASSRLIHDTPPLSFLGNGLVLEFVGGVALALFHSGTALRPRAGMVALTLGVAIWLGLSPTLDAAGFAGVVDAEQGRMDWIRAAIYGPAAAFIIWGALQAEQMVAGRAWNWPVYLGGASFAIYLTHTLPLLVGEHMAVRIPRGWGIPYLLADMAMAVALSLLVYEMVERPMARLIQRARFIPAAALSAPAQP